MVRRFLFLGLALFFVNASTGLAGPGFWTPFNQGLDFADVRVLVTDPADPNIIYAGTWGAGVFKTVDAGQSWSAFRGESLFISHLAIDPTDSETLYVGTGGGLSKTTDGGASWTLMTDGIRFLDDPAPIDGLALDPSDPQTLYIGTAVGFFKSENGGIRWAEMELSEFAANQPFDFIVETIAIDPKKASNLYAGTSAAGVFKSLDGGDTWERLAELSLATPRDLAIDPSNSQILYAGYGFSLQKSTDGGETWQSIEVKDSRDRPVAMNQLVFDPQIPNKIMAATSNGVYVSLDAGANWSSPQTDLEFQQVQTLAIAPRGASLYAGTRWGVFRNTDSCCTTWSESSVGLSNVAVWTFAVDPQSPSNLYLGTNYGFFRSDAPTAPWQEMAGDSLRFTLWVNDLLAVPGLTTSGSPTRLFAGLTIFGVFQSLDAGEEWQLAPDFPSQSVSTVAAAPREPSKIYAAIDEPGLVTQVYQTEDGGQTWNSASEGLERALGVAKSLAVDTQNPPNVYLGTDSPTSGRAGVFKRSGTETSWQSANQGIESLSVFALAVDPEVPQIVYAGGNGLEPLADGLYRSADGGESWKPVLELEDEWIESLAIDPRHPQVVYASSWRHIYRSQDRGKTWSILDADAAPTLISEINIDPLDSSKLYAGTLGRGIWQLTLGDLELRASNSVPFSLGSGPVTHTVTVTNRGTYDATGIVIDLQSTLPEGVEITRIVPSGRTLFSRSEWRISNLAVGQTETLSVFLVVDDAPSGWNLLRTEASLKAVNEPDFNPENDIARAMTSIVQGVRSSS